MNKLSVTLITALLTCISIVISASSWAASPDHSVSAKLVSVISQQKVSLNEASVEQLVLLKGIGEKKAQAIISYRTRHGAFTSVEQVVNVKGIGEKILMDNKSILTI
jgi:competence protein ComEA